MRANEQNTHVFRRTQTLVGLMCWFAAKETRSPFLARFASSANPPIVRRSHELNSARPSSRVRRSLRATFSAIGARARSRAVTDVGDYGLRIADWRGRVANPQFAIRNPQFHAARRTASVTLWPPNPNEFDSASSTGRFTALLGAESRSQAGSGVNWLMVGGMTPDWTMSAHKAASNAPAAPRR